MNIALYYDLPQGGANRTMEEIEEILAKEHTLTRYANLPQSFSPSFLRHFFADVESILLQRFKQKYQAKKIDEKRYDLVFVTHDRHSQAPWVLRYLKTPTVFLCQEPTRAYFEYRLRIDPSLPLVNKIYETLNRSLRKQIEINNARHATSVVANSHYSSESIDRAYGLESTPIHLGIDAKKYYPEKTHKKNQVIVIGNNEPQKDLPLAIRSVSLIDKSIRPRLIIASPRKVDNSDLVRLAKRLKVKLTIMVGLNQEGLRHQYSQSVATLATAHLEPFGLSVVESLACGTPVVAVREGGFRETVDSGITGLLTDRKPEKIARAMTKIILDKVMAKRMGERGRHVVIKKFTWENTVKKLNEVFYEIKKT